MFGQSKARGIGSFLIDKALWEIHRALL